MFMFKARRRTSSRTPGTTSVRLARILPLFMVLAIPVSAEAQEGCTIAHVVDGDTFNCRDGRNVRLLLVDAPEAGRFGGVARRALVAFMPTDTTFGLETDTIPRDEKGRTLAYVFLSDGRLLNEILVREGYAFYKPSRGHTRYADRMRAAEEAARAERRGVWAP
jgi:micrococcal nuclease